MIVNTKKGKLQAQVDNGLQINIISPKVIERLDLPYHNKKRLFQMIVVDRIMTSYNNSSIYLEILELLIVVEGRQFYISFNIALIGSTDMILGWLQLKVVKPQLDYKREELIQLDGFIIKVEVKEEKPLCEVIIEVLKIITKEIPKEVVEVMRIQTKPRWVIL